MSKWILSKYFGQFVEFSKEIVQDSDQLLGAALTGQLCFQSFFF